MVTPGSTASNFGHGFSGSFDLQGVSDDTYFTDLSDKIAATSQTNLPREGNLFYDGDWWNLNARVQRFQTLQDPLAPVTPPYARVPQITLNVNRQTDYHLDLGLQGEYVDFDHPVPAERQTPDSLSFDQRAVADVVFLLDAQDRLSRHPLFLRGSESPRRNAGVCRSTASTAR